MKHQFLAGEFSKRIGRELLDLYLNGPNIQAQLATQEDEDEPDILIKAPRRISNKKEEKNEKAQHQIASNNSNHQQNGNHHQNNNQAKNIPMFKLEDSK